MMSTKQKLSAKEVKKEIKRKMGDESAEQVRVERSRREKQDKFTEKGLEVFEEMLEVARLLKGQLQQRQQAQDGKEEKGEL